MITYQLGAKELVTIKAEARIRYRSQFLRFPTLGAGELKFAAKTQEK